MEDGWSALAAQWSELWGSTGAPVHEALIAAAGIRAGTRVLDVGCGSGEFLRALGAVGARATGIDPAPGMVEVARRVAPLAEVRLGGAERLGWPDGSFDVVTAVNALQFADDTVEALGGFARVLAPGGLVAVANWAEGARNDLDAVEAAVAAADGVEPGPDGELRVAGGLEAVMEEGGFEIVTAGLVEVPWLVADDETLVRGVLLGEDPSVMRELGPVVLEAARPFRVGHGYRLSNAYRYAVAKTRA